jgi:hypothetical protein
MPSLDEFRATIAGKDLARQNRFEVKIWGPGGMKDEQVNLLAESVSIPGQNIRSVPDDLRYGPARDHAQGVTYGDISMTFICTPGMQEKVYFEEWQKRIVQLGERDPGWNVNFYKDYVGEIQIDQLDKQNQMKYQVTIVEAWPKTINAQEFTLSSNDSYQTVSVDFAYRYWFRSYLSMAVHVPPKPPRPYIDRIRGMADPKILFEKEGEIPNTPATRQAKAAAATARINAHYGRLSKVGRKESQ